MQHVRERGFTLMELMVVIAIVTVLSSVLLANLRPATRRMALETGVGEAVALLRQARTNSVAVAQYQANYFPSYGVYFSTNSGENTQLILYADCVADDNSSTQIEFSDSFGPGQNNCVGVPETVETVPLRGDTRISAITFTPAGGTSETLQDFSILYLRPEPTIWFSSEGTSRDAGVAVIEFTSGTGPETETMSIRFNSGGLIERIL